MRFTNFLPALAAIPAVLATLPRTFELLAFQNGQRIGCINGYGNFVTNKLVCYPYNTVGDPAETNYIFGYEPCSAANGSFVCWQAEGERSLFGLSGADLNLIGVGTLWSADSLPDSQDRYGVPVNIGNEGSQPIFLQVHGISG
ncbi:hypothetical protein CkaCkLH20_07268 [Colletotrichum karsti]|uniref:Uncharacterized protein n=1 Tax=Colletotrichum karsti TaxID=1095194 RepID=A0A9P6I2V7_9PEZI|nr:uncharacterized protein CkaCkLH20_07268 [Colletotrichum karsti]KAF9875448.1 hypothetical protein CkaCkLH20_07268 [Colletotrichum karsti]